MKIHQKWGQNWSWTLFGRLLDATWRSDSKEDRPYLHFDSILGSILELKIDTFFNFSVHDPSGSVSKNRWKFSCLTEPIFWGSTPLPSDFWSPGWAQVWSKSGSEAERNIEWAKCWKYYENPCFFKILGVRPIRKPMKNQSKIRSKNGVNIETLPNRFFGGSLAILGPTGPQKNSPKIIQGARNPEKTGMKSIQFFWPFSG